MVVPIVDQPFHLVGTGEVTPVTCDLAVGLMIKQSFLLNIRMSDEHTQQMCIERQEKSFTVVWPREVVEEVVNVSWDAHFGSKLSE
jgi:hypothetical protein